LKLQLTKIERQIGKSLVYYYSIIIVLYAVFAFGFCPNRIFKTISWGFCCLSSVTCVRSDASANVLQLKPQENSYLSKDKRLPWLPTGPPDVCPQLPVPPEFCIEKQAYRVSLMEAHGYYDSKVIQKDWRIFRVVLNHQAGEWSSFGPNSWWTSIKDTLNPFKSTMSKPNKYTSIRFSLPMQNWSSINTSFCCFMVGNSHDDFVKTKDLSITQLKDSNSM